MPAFGRYSLLYAGVLLVASCSGDASGPGKESYTIGVLSGDNQAIVAGSSAGQPLVLEIVDGRGAPKGGVSLHWIGSGVFPADTTLVSASDGTVHLIIRADTIAGYRSASVNLVGSSTPPRTFGIAVVPGPAVRAVGVGDTTRLGVDAVASFGPLFVDRYGNAITDKPTYAIADTTVASISTGSLVAKKPGLTGMTLRLGNLSVTTVLSLVGWKQIVGGWNDACGITTENRLYCWGSGHLGAAGTTLCNASARPDTVINFECSPAPAPTMPGTRFTSVTMSETHACALDLDGHAWCWGQNQYGSLGDGSTTDGATPVAVAGGLTFTKVTTGYHESCGQTASGQIYCWGEDLALLGNGAGGGGFLNPITRPALTSAPAGSQLVAGRQMICGVVGGAPYCWGMFYTGAQGAWAISQNQNTPVRYGAPYTYSAFVPSSTGSTFCGISSERLYCWGHNDQGQLGNGTTDPSLAPVEVAGNLRVRAVALAMSFACAVDDKGDPWCWGSDSFKELGTPAATTCRVEKYPCTMTPTAVAGAKGKDFVQMALASATAFGVTSKGEAYSWGFGTYGTLGTGKPIYTAGVGQIAVPVAVNGASGTSARMSAASTRGLPARVGPVPNAPTVRVTYQNGKIVTMMTSAPR